MTLTLGIDVGTSGVRTAVLQDEALVSTARAGHPAQDTKAIDANLWWHAVADCLTKQMDMLRAEGTNPAEITGLAIDGTSGSMVLTDADLTPVSPALMYNSKGFDAEAERISAQVETDHITKGVNSALARAMRLVNLSSEAPVHLLHQADFISAKMMGRGGHSDFNNALKTGFDPQTGQWPAWVDQVIDPGLLPVVHSPGAPIGKIDPTVAAQFGLSPDVTIHAGTTDSIAAFLACTPARDPGIAVTSLGSTLAIKILSPNRIDDPRIGLYSHRLGDLWLVGGASNTGGAVLAKHFSPEEIVRLSDKIDPEHPTGLNYYPLNEPGERFPINDPALPPRLEPRPADKSRFLQAMFEGIARIEATCYQEIKTRGGDLPTQIFSAGGGANNPIFTRIRALALGVEPSISAMTEAAIGSAKLARPS